MDASKRMLCGQLALSEASAQRFITLLCFALVLYSLYAAYSIRLLSLELYGWVIHEFDPWFNFRATQYLSDHGWDAFFHWYDYMSWYPLGRPVGTTIYPGLQITSVVIHEALNMIGINMSLNDVCVYIPAWFGSIATVFAALIAYESTRSISAAAVTAYLFAIVPAHLMRSMAGEYDNECIAVAVMLATFYAWVRSLRGPTSWPIGVVAGLAYGYMVSTWGGYVFVLNMVAVHAGTCVLVDWARNRYDVSLLRAYSLFFVVGTALATLVPPVGWAPFRSLEQLMPLLLFIFMWALHFSELLRRRADAEVRSVKTLQIRSRVFLATLGAVVLVAALLAPRGYFGPISSRVRALFVEHTRTGNPLVDSVAEHRPADGNAYWTYLHVCYPLWAFGILTILVARREPWTSRAAAFLLVYSLVAYYFSARMSRLILLTGPVATACSGFLFGASLDWAIAKHFWEPEANAGSPVQTSEESKNKNTTKHAKKEKNGKGKTSDSASSNEGGMAMFLSTWSNEARMTVAIALIVLIVFNPALITFRAKSYNMSAAFANPRLMWQTRLSNGAVVMIDDYREAYWFLRDKTPEDARILSWWDYGYQITGIGNRTTLADGNTWNHEHIATIGKMLASPVKEAHSLIRHLADYVLIWAGHAGDLGKSPHMARIGNSVYRDICPEEDPLCTDFGFYSTDFRKPTPMMRKSLLYNLHDDGTNPDVKLSKNLFQLAYVSKYGLVKIYKVMNVSEESKQWVANPKNRKCDAPGSWLCAGQYPPAKEIQDLLAKRIDYGQLEDFNRGKKDDAYYRAYMRRSRQGRK